MRQQFSHFKKERIYPQETDDLASQNRREYQPEDRLSARSVLIASRTPGSQKDALQFVPQVRYATTSPRLFAGIVTRPGVSLRQLAKPVTIRHGRVPGFT